MIRVAGILMTILGVIAFMITISALSVSYSYGDLYTALLYFELVGTALTLAFGISGIAMAANKEKGGTIKVFGIIILAYRVIDLVWFIGAFNDNFMSFSSIIASGIIGCVLPILYIIGGNTAQAARQSDITR